MKEWNGKPKMVFPKIDEVSLKAVSLPTLVQPKWDGETGYLFFHKRRKEWVTSNSWGHYRTDYPVTDKARELELDKNLIYIGELCAGENLYDFLRSRKKHPENLFFRIFDCSGDKGTYGSLTDFSLRYNVLFSMFPNTRNIQIDDFGSIVGSIVNTIDLVPYYLAEKYADLSHIFKTILDAGFEGIVCKDYFYSGMVKVKAKRTVDVVILGIAKSGKHYTSGTGFSTLLVGLYHNGKYLKVGRVGTGINEITRATVYKELLKKWDHEDNKYIYVDPTEVMEITFNQLISTKNFEVDKTFRSARIKRMRPDKETKDCKLEHQLPEAKPI